MSQIFFYHTCKTILNFVHHLLLDLYFYEIKISSYWWQIFCLHQLQYACIYLTMWVLYADKWFDPDIRLWNQRPKEHLFPQMIFFTLFYPNSVYLSDSPSSFLNTGSPHTFSEALWHLFAYTLSAGKCWMFMCKTHRLDTSEKIPGIDMSITAQLRELILSCPRLQQL